MDNYILFSNGNKASHNAYTQVASEMGLCCYSILFAFMIAPLKRLRNIERKASIPSPDGGFIILPSAYKPPGGLYGGKPFRLGCLSMVHLLSRRLFSLFCGAFIKPR